MNAKVSDSSGQLVGFETMSERHREKRKPDAPMNKVTGKPDPSWNWDLSEDELSDLDSSEVEFGLCHPLAAFSEGGDMETVDLIRVAKHLSSQLDSFIRHGDKLNARQREKLEPILEKHAETIRQTRRRTRGHILARLSVAAALDSSRACRAYEWTRDQRGRRWTVPDGDTDVTVTVDRIEQLAQSKPRDHLGRAAAIYRMLARDWGHIDPLPKKVEKGVQGSDLEALLSWYLARSKKS